MFGERGQFAVFFDPALLLHTTSYTNTSASYFYARFEPSLEYFVARNVSIGLELDVSYSVTKNGSPIRTSNTAVGGGVHFALNVPFGDRLSLYPLLALGVHRSETVATGPSSFSAGSSSATYVVAGPWVSFILPLLYHPAPHFFVGVGPSVYHDFDRTQGSPSVTAERTAFGGRLLFGGYFDFRRPQSDVTTKDEPETSRRRPAFGAANTVLLTDENSISFSSTHYAGSDSSDTSLSVGPGIDWFYTEDQSVGFQLSYAHSHSASGSESSGVTQTDDSLGLTVRYGYNLELGDWLSLYPRLGLTYMHTIFDGANNGTSYSGTLDQLSASLTVPLLVHLATHLVVGAGPEVVTDLYAGEGGGRPQVRGTTVGITSLLGGWF